ncbi:MAG TPA: hypothetical protein VGS22_21100 [Thermoanaerobaculia bacterium]|jgi:hypothetical protein|nr:hypothetical protein [Thermoanaerobaculia bacterium]
MEKSLIFVSCGQCTDEEKNLGKAIQRVIDQSSDLKSYFAESVHDLESLDRHVFGALRDCVGGVIVMHPRGRVLDATSNEWGIRSSVWINQEIAILAYRRMFEGLEIPTIVFADSRVRLEGAMTTLIVNPRILGKTDEVLRKIKDWLDAANFSKASPKIVSDNWERLTEPSKKVVAAIIDAGGSEVIQVVLQRVLMKDYGLSEAEVGSVINAARSDFASTGLVSWCSRESGLAFSVHRTWEPGVRRKVKDWQAGR